MSKRIVSNLTRLTGLVLVTLAVACGGTEGDAAATGAGGAGGAGGGEGRTGSMPSALVGSWYAGSGYTSAPYDPQTGAWGTPSGSGLVYVLRANGTYTKAFQSYYSSTGCTSGFTVFEEGVATVEGGTIVFRPSSGHKKYSDSCAPSLNSDDPVTDLSGETLSWALGQDQYDASTVLQLANEQGASSIFHLL